MPGVEGEVLGVVVEEEALGPVVERPRLPGEPGVAQLAAGLQKRGWAPPRSGPWGVGPP